MTDSFISLLYHQLLQNVYMYTYLALIWFLGASYAFAQINSPDAKATIHHAGKAYPVPESGILKIPITSGDIKLEYQTAYKGIPGFIGYAVNRIYREDKTIPQSSAKEHDNVFLRRQDQGRLYKSHVNHTDYDDYHSSLDNPEGHLWKKLLLWHGRTQADADYDLRKKWLYPDPRKQTRRSHIYRKNISNPTKRDKSYVTSGTEIRSYGPPGQAYSAFSEFHFTIIEVTQDKSHKVIIINTN